MSPQCRAHLRLVDPLSHAAVDRRGFFLTALRFSLPPLETAAIQPTGFKYIVTVSRASFHSLTRHTTTDVHDDIPEAESSSDEPLDVSLIELCSYFASSRSVNENLGQGGRAGLSSHWEESDQSLTEVWSNVSQPSSDLCWKHHRSSINFDVKMKLLTCLALLLASQDSLVCVVSAFAVRCY